MNDLEEEEQLLMEVAGRRKPTKTPRKKRKRRSISISEEDESYSGGSEEGELDKDEQEENIPRSRGATDNGNKAQRTQEDKTVIILCNTRQNKPRHLNILSSKWYAPALLLIS